MQKACPPIKQTPDSQATNTRNDESQYSTVGTVGEPV
jgi:hypothetical protein